MPVKAFRALFSGPAAFVAVTGWHALAAVIAAIGIFLVSIATAMIVKNILADQFEFLTDPASSASVQSVNQISTKMLIWILIVQVTMIILTWFASSLFRSQPKDVLALRTPHPSYAVVIPALLLVFTAIAVYSLITALLFPHEVLQDIKPFIDVLRTKDAALLVFVAVIGAPLSEELIFRGFLLSALAKSKLGYLGAALITTAIWTLLHANYSISGLGAVLIIGLVLSWLLWRTGSLWVTIICHAIYNGAVVLILSMIELPTG